MSDNMARTEVADHAWQPLRILGRGFNKLGLATGPAQVKTVPVGLDQAFGHQPSYKALDLNMFVARGQAASSLASVIGFEARRAAMVDDS